MRHFFLISALICLCELVQSLNEKANSNLEIGTPTVSVNYIPKRQWTTSKQELSEIKLAIEREVNFTLIRKVKR